MESGNPILKRFGKVAKGGSPMTVDGAVEKSLLLLAVMVAVAVATVMLAPRFPVPVMIGAIVGALIGLGIAIALAFKPEWSPALAPIYGVVEGVFVGWISYFFESMYPGIVLQAVALTLAVAFLMLFLYRTRIIKVTRGFLIGVLIATGAIALVYVVTMVLGLFGIAVPYIHDGGPIGIAFSVVVVGVAALNLILDFHVIEHAAKERAPKFMEWYAAFGLLVTLVWLYVELLRLLAKIRGND
jgi:uncharacterized YccA/Bax inhibitor family protein